MPPKKKTKAAVITATNTSTRSTRSRKQQDDASSVISVESVKTVNSTGSAKRKRAGSLTATARSTKKAKESTETWWDEVTGHSNAEILDGEGFQKWIEDLKLDPSGIFMYLILYKCQANTSMTITKEQFIRFMDSIGVKSNSQLLTVLPTLLSEIRPCREPCPNPNFKAFYKWCFQHFKPEGQKGMPVDFAEIILQTLLDPTRYHPDWVLDDYPPKNEEFPHVDAFCEYITQSEPRPVHVINKDQFEQFYEFNLAVSWSAVEHSEDSAWPALIDSYVAWKREKYPA
ncbi:Cullin binding-domain-containing protein [Pyronema omphalodes]|nr:Cullin binding-domain-containing protein [Pyronema omphalodes]